MWLMDSIFELSSLAHLIAIQVHYRTKSSSYPCATWHVHSPNVAWHVHTGSGSLFVRPHTLPLSRFSRPSIHHHNFCVRLHILVCGLILVMLQAVVLGGVVLVLCILYSQHHALARRMREEKHPLIRSRGMSRGQVQAGSAHHETSRQVLNEGMTARDRPVQIYSSIPCNCTDRLPDMPSPSCTHSDGTPRAAITPYAHTLIDQAQVWAAVYRVAVCSITLCSIVLPHLLLVCPACCACW